MHTKKTETQALVLGGGSVAGVAWELGMITDLREKGVDALLPVRSTEPLSV